MTPEEQLDFACAIITNPAATNEAKLMACRTIIDTTDPDMLDHTRAQDLATLITGEMAAPEIS